jgi:hypothetical protein
MYVCMYVCMYMYIYTYTYKYGVAPRRTGKRNARTRSVVHLNFVSILYLIYVFFTFYFLFLFPVFYFCLYFVGNRDARTARRQLQDKYPPEQMCAGPSAPGRGPHGRCHVRHL